eukprot:gene15292-21376_t
MLPWEQSNGDVVTRYFQIESFPGEAHIGVSYETFRPDLPTNDVVVEPIILESDGTQSDGPGSDGTESDVQQDIVIEPTVKESDGKESDVKSDEAPDVQQDAVVEHTAKESDGTQSDVPESDEAPDVQQDAAAAFVPLSMPAVAVNKASIPQKPDHGRRKLQQANLTRIDILVLYTTAAASAMGGDTASVNKISSMITTANQIYANSEINMRLNVVAVERVSYNEDQSNPTSLADLLSGKVPVALALRAQYGADIVQMVTVDQTYCGIGYTPLPHIPSLVDPRRTDLRVGLTSASD